MSSLTTQIDALKQAIVKGNDFDSIMTEIIENQGINAIRPLLVMLDYSDEMSQEKYIVTHAVESFPRKTYFGELVTIANDMNVACPDFMDFLLARIMNSSDDIALFLSTVDSTTNKNAIALVEALKRVQKKYSVKPDIVRNSIQCITHLSRSD